MRQQFWPTMRPTYAGYLAWRGLLPEDAMQPAARETLHGDFGFALLLPRRSRDGRQCWYLGSAGRKVPQHASQDAPSVSPSPAKMNTPPEPRMPVQPIAAAEAGAGQSVPFALRVDQANTVADDPVMNSSAPWANIATSSPPVESSSGSIWNSAIEE